MNVEYDRLKKPTRKYLVVVARRHRDYDGNTYHTVSVASEGKHLSTKSLQYGYGSHAEDTVLELITEARWIKPGKWVGLRHACSELNIELYITTIDVNRKGEL
mgnify:CR=1 FL=1